MEDNNETKFTGFTFGQEDLPPGLEVIRDERSEERVKEIIKAIKSESKKIDPFVIELRDMFMRKKDGGNEKRRALNTSGTGVAEALVSDLKLEPDQVSLLTVEETNDDWYKKNILPVYEDDGGRKVLLLEFSDKIPHDDMMRFAATINRGMDDSLESRQWNIVKMPSRQLPNSKPADKDNLSRIMVLVRA